MERKGIKEIREKINKMDSANDDKDTVTVHLNVSDSDIILSDYNAEGKEIISSDMATFIDNVTKPIKPHQKIHLKINCNNYSEKNEGKFRNAIKNYYVNEFAELDRKLRNNMVMSIIMLCAGVVGFSLLWLLSLINTPFIVYTLVEVASWVFIWELVDLLCLQRYFIKYKLYKKANIIYAKISFNKNEK